MAKASTCPDVGELQRLASGHLLAPQVETLVGHLETCAPCLAKVQTLTPDDTLVSSLSLAREQAAGQDAEVVARMISKLKKLAAAPSASGTITFACTHCGKTLKTKAALAGKKVKCPGCGQATLAPAAPALASAADDRTLAPRDTPSSFAPVAHAHGSSSVADDHTEAGEHSGAEDAWDFLAPPQTADEIGRLGGYRILKVLGRGGMGVVFRAEDPSLKRIVALKAMLPSLAASPSAKKRFLREAQTAASIKHDHIVTIHQVGEDRGAPFLAMEFLHGEPLDVRLKRESRLPIPEVLRIGREVAEGLAAAHDEGLIHRDIKPANIWLESRGGVSGREVSGKTGHHSPLTTHHSLNRVKILDFGLARSTDDQAGLTQTGAIIGTPAYMSPEQGQGADVDHRCDLFSLGCVLYVMATGQLPFKGKDTISTLMSVATDKAPAPRSLNPETPQGLSDLIGRLLAKKPENRPANAHEVVAVLHALEVNHGEQTATLKRLETPAANKAKAPGPKSRRGLLVACGLALVAAVVLVAGLVFFLPTANGVVRIEINDDDIEVVLTKTGATFKGKGKQPDLTVAPGEHMFKVKRGDLEFETDKFVLKKGETVTLKVEFLQGKLQAALADGKIIGVETAKAKPADPAAERRVAEWVLGKKGRLRIRFRGTPMDVNQLDQLPKDPFTVLEVNLAMGGNFNAEQIFNDDLRQLALLVNLEHLNLGRQPVTVDGLAHLTGLGELRGLILYSGTVGLDAIPVVAKFTKLERFMFPSEKSDAWAAALAKIPTLRYVNAYRTDITDAGVIHLARLPKLDELILDDCGGTTDASLKALASCKSLRTLVLPPDIGQPGRMTWAEVARLQKALPDCDIQPKK